MPVNGKTSARGYGWRHQKLRERWSRVVAMGGVLCARCGEPIEPGAAWDLGHLDGSGKTLYQGPEHRRCNRGARPGRRRHSFPWDGEPMTRRYSREW